MNILVILIKFIAIGKNAPHIISSLFNQVVQWSNSSAETGER